MVGGVVPKMWPITVSALLIAMVAVGCLPVQDAKLQKGACNQDEEFNPVNRRCEPLEQVTTFAPTNTLMAVELEEDVTQVVTLTYSDLEGNLATACSVTEVAPAWLVQTVGQCSCIGGICSIQMVSQSNRSGQGGFKYTVTDRDGTSEMSVVAVTIANADDAPVVTAAYNYNTLFSEDYFTNYGSQKFYLGYSDLDGDKATSCEVSVSGSDAAYDSQSCTCESVGTCYYSMSREPTRVPYAGNNLNRTFAYRVKAGGLWSNWSSAANYAIAAINYLPTPVAATPVANVSEGFSNVTYKFYYSEPDLDVPSDCTVDDLSNLSAATTCSCTSSNCQVTLLNTAGVNDNSATKTYSFIYRFYDGFDGSVGADSSTVTLNVSAVDDDATIDFDLDTFSGSEGTPLVVDLPNDLGNWGIDEGGASDEDSQTIYMRVRTTADSTVLSSAGVYLIKNGVTLTPVASMGTPLATGWYDLGDGDQDILAHLASEGLELKLVPQEDESAADNFDVTIDICQSTDFSLTTGCADATSDSFLANFSEVDDESTVVQFTPNHFYDTFARAGICDDPSTVGVVENCTRSYDVTEDTINFSPVHYGTIFFNYRTGVSYVSDEAGAWHSFVTDCPFFTSVANSSDGDYGCRRGVGSNYYLNCIGDEAPTFTTSNAGSYYFDYAHNRCYQSSSSGWSEVSEITARQTLCESITTTDELDASADNRAEIYRDTTGDCYYLSWDSSSDTSDDYEWLAVNAQTHCPVSLHKCKRQACADGDDSCEDRNCIGEGAPEDMNDANYSVVPAAVGNYYYDNANDICYVSVRDPNSAQNYLWAVYGSEISDIEGYEGGEFILKDLHFDEGGGNGENEQSIALRLNLLRENFETDSNAGFTDLFDTTDDGEDNNAIDESQVQVLCNGYDVTDDENAYYLLSDWACRADSSEDSYKSVKIVIRPHTTAIGRAEIMMDISSDEATVPIQRTFSLIAYPLSTAGVSWEDVVAVGNKVEMVSAAATPVAADNIFIKLTWEDLTLIAGDGDYHASSYAVYPVTGYHVYRGYAEASIDYEHPLNPTPVAVGTNFFIDNVNNTTSLLGPPRPGTIYYYDVRAVTALVAGTVATVPNNSDHDVMRVIAPPDNMAFVPRRMANKDICSYLEYVDAAAAPDDDNYNRCRYNGPGATLDNGVSYYDIGGDLLVDRFEAGCPIGQYTANGTLGQKFVNQYCDETGGSRACYGQTTPSGAGVDDAAYEQVYYSRANGVCYYDPTADDWRAFGGSADDDASTDDISSDFALMSQRPYLPPLVQISQHEAQLLCTSRPSSAIKAGESDVSPDGWRVQIGNAARLPTRKEQVAYTSWGDRESVNEEDLGTLEMGGDMSASHKCNSSGASGYEAYYLNTDTVSSGSYFALPGNNDSTIRSMITGSSVTGYINGGSFNGCISRYGIQDAVGNVKEWTTDLVYCPTENMCKGVYYTDATKNNGYLCPFNLATDVEGTDIASGVTSCGNGNGDFNCLGAAVPSAAEVPVSGLIYYDYDDEDCYVSWNGSWTLFYDGDGSPANGCPISSVAYESACADITDDALNCVGAVDPSADNLTPTQIGSYHYNYVTQSCFKSIGTEAITDWEDVSPTLHFEQTSNFVPENRLPRSIADAQLLVHSTDDYYAYWALDGRYGPCVNGTCDSEMTGWVWNDRSNGASHIFYPLGLPLIDSFLSNFSSLSAVTPMELSSSAGLSEEQLHGDAFSVYSSSIYNNSLRHRGSFATGGSYRSSLGKAGRYTLDLYPEDATNDYGLAGAANGSTGDYDDGDANATYRDDLGPDLGFRCVVPISESDY